MKKACQISTEEFTGRVTRARAAALHANASKIRRQQVQKQALPTRSKRAALHEASSGASENQRKRRAVLQDVTNVSCDQANGSCFKASKVKKIKPAKEVVKVSKMAPMDTVAISHTQVYPKENTDQVMKKEPESEEVEWPGHSEEALPFISQTISRCNKYFKPKKEDAGFPSHSQSCLKQGKKQRSYRDSVMSRNRDVIDIDSDNKDPQLCSLYAMEIYNSLRVAELVRRPYPDFMERVQNDITISMRAILIDWLVETSALMSSNSHFRQLARLFYAVFPALCMFLSVSEEYKLEPDTLYLTVYLIDWFLSQNCIERQRLQLLGITCMFIASKYEEICAPRVEELCFITDNTYTREEVLKLESQVLKYCGFQVFAPTAKTFLRRFLRAAQASYKSPSFELEYLANYLTELTLIDYGFLKSQPSIIAASAVFLARWTIDQTSHPWNPTLEHYTFYKASDLKITVLALQHLQLNSGACPLAAIRSKYRQEKFKAVAALSSRILPETIF